MKKIKASKEELEKAYRSGMTIKELQASLGGVTLYMLYETLNRHGIKRRSSQYVITP